MIDLTVSIVNHDNRLLLDRCLRSIYENTHGISFEVIVVDNASRDHSAEHIAQGWPDVILIKNQERKGFSANHNQALRVARGKYMVILNNDTEVRRDCFAALCSYLDKHPDSGAAGPRVVNPDGTLQQSVFRMPSLSVLVTNAFFLGKIFPRSLYFAGYGAWPHDRESDVPFLGGACIMFPTGLLRTLGGLDERFFMYTEDADICLRVRQAGRRVVFVPQAEIMHVAGGSLAQTSDRSIHFRYTSMHAFFKKHFGAWSVPAAAAFNVLGAANRALIFGAARRLGSRARREEFREKHEYFLRVLKWYRGRRLP